MIDNRMASLPIMTGGFDVGINFHFLDSSSFTRNYQRIEEIIRTKKSDTPMSDSKYYFY